MASTIELQALAKSQHFRERLRALMLLEASVIIADTGNPQKTARIAFAQKLLTTPGLCDQYVDWFSTRTNLIARNVTYDFTLQALVCSITDAEFRSQINTDWNTLAGVIP